MGCPTEDVLLAATEASFSIHHAPVYDHIATCARCRLMFNDPARLRRSDEDELGTGHYVGRYQLQAIIGSGGMGVVYRAHDPELERDVALKVLRAEQSNQPHRRAGLLREARAMAQLSHPNVAAVHDAGVHRERVFIAMELVRGMTLRRKHAGETSWQVVIPAYLQAARGLAAAHAAGLVHRDFKPDNALVGDDGRVRVIDFGLVAVTPLEAAPPGSAVPAGREATGRAVCGTLAYMALEAMRGGPVDLRADQFSFCVALFQQLYGTLPYAGDTLAEREAEILREQIARPGDASVPEALYAVLRRGLSADPAARYLSMDELTAAIEAAVGAASGLDAARRDRAPAIPSVRVEVPCPYPGMRPFTGDDTDRFHGRDAEVAQLIDRLRTGEREIFVIGPSGSGKSSLVTAGVLPRLARGVAGLGPFVVRELRPGEQPATRLGQVLEAPAGATLAAADRVASLLAPRGRDVSFLIVIDQLEELFTLASAGERAQFLSALRALRAEPRCALVFTLRADFFGALMESALWTERRGQLARVEVSPLRGEALREVIAAPAHAAGVTIDPDLIERLVGDVAGEPGILPLLQETLVQLWHRRVSQTITLADYQALGDGEHSGLAVALARRADATLRRFSAAQVRIVRRILLRLVSFGDGRSDTRRQQPRAQLRAASDDPADFAFVLQAMIDDRLLTADDEIDGEPRVDLAHEVMIAAWPALARWISAHRVDEQRRRQLEAAAARWVEHGRRGRGLLDPVELADAKLWQQTDSALELGDSAAVTALIAASSIAQTRQRRHRRVIVGGVALLGLVAITVTVAALAARDQANEAHRLAEVAHDQAIRVAASDRRNRELVARSYADTGRQLFTDHQFQEAVPYLLAARQLGEDAAPLRWMFWQTQRYLPVFPSLEHQGEVMSAAFSPDGTRIVTTSSDRTARVWDAATGKPLTGALAHREAVMNAAFSPDSARIVTASADNTARVWNARTGEPVTRPLEHEDGVVIAAFSPDGARIVTASWDHTARVWDAATGKPIGRPLRHRAQVWSAAFSPDGARIVTASADNTARVWHAATGEPIGPPLVHQDSVWGARFSPDGTRIVTASWDHTARVWDAATGKPIGPPLEHRANVWTAAFSPDGTRIATASADNTARVWDAASGRPLGPPLAHQGWVRTAAFTPDGARIVTASDDGTARVWDAATGKPLAAPFTHQGMLWSAAFSPDATRVVTASADNTARVWSTDRRSPAVLEHQQGVASAAFSPDGTRIVTASWDNTARVWDAATGNPRTGPLPHRGWVRTAAFSPDGTRVVTASHDKTARVWDAATGELLTPPLVHQAQVWSAAFSPDGTRVVTASYDKTARVWSAATGKPVLPPLVHQGWVRTAAFSPDGTRIVTASADKTARVWDATTGRPITAPLPHLDVVATAAFSPDGTRVVTASYDKTARVWDATTGRPITAPLRHREDVHTATFSPDGARVVTASTDRTARIWSATTGEPLTGPLEHREAVVRAAFSPDGTRIVTASRDSTARVWDAATGKPLTGALEHQANVVSSVFSPDGTRVLTGSLDRTARVWDVVISASGDTDNRAPARATDARGDTDTLDRWAAVAARSPFVLDERGVLTRHAKAPAQPRSD